MNIRIVVNCKQVPHIMSLHIVMTALQHITQAKVITTVHTKLKHNNTIMQ